MFLTITSTAEPATDLGYLLHKHPDRVQTFSESVGQVHVFYPEATAQRCTVAVLLEVDPIGLVRRGRRGKPEAFALAQYVNDRPYAASSMLAVALGRVFKTARNGRCDARPELVDQPLALQIRLPAVPGGDLARELFAPLGWEVASTRPPLDPELPQWGDAPYAELELTGRLRLAEALNQLYVLLPVLDDAKHYWVSTDEVDKLVRAGSGWLGTHPARELITRRYLAHQRSLADSAAARLAELDGIDLGEDDDPADELGTRAAAPPTLAAQRRDAVLTVLRERGATRVLDLGCGEGTLLSDLLAEHRFTEIVGADVSDRALRRAEQRLQLDRLPERQRARIRLLQSSLSYRDRRLSGYDAAVLMEVIEHLDPSRLPTLEQTVFTADTDTVIITTPNAEHNSHFGLGPGEFRHPDHRFEWTRGQFRSWAEQVAGRTGYRVRFLPIGPDDPEHGPPTQLAVFERIESSQVAA